MSHRDAARRLYANAHTADRSTVIISVQHPHQISLLHTEYSVHTYSLGGLAHDASLLRPDGLRHGKDKSFSVEHYSVLRKACNIKNCFCEALN